MREATVKSVVEETAAAVGELKKSLEAALISNNSLSVEGDIFAFDVLPRKLQHNDTVIRQHLARALIEVLEENAKAVDSLIAESHGGRPAYAAIYRKDLQIVRAEIQRLYIPKASPAATSGRSLIYSQPLRVEIKKTLDAMFKAHDARASFLTKRWRSIKKLFSSDDLKQKRKEKFLAKYNGLTDFFPKGNDVAEKKADLWQEMCKEVTEIRNTAATEMLAAKSVAAIDEIVARATSQFFVINADSEAAPLGTGNEPALAYQAINGLGDFCKIPFTEAKAYSAYQNEDVSETLQESLDRVDTRYNAIPEEFRPQESVKKDIKDQITKHAEQKIAESKSIATLVKAKVNPFLPAWNKIQTAIRSMDVSPLLGALSTLAPQLYAPDEGALEISFNHFFKLIPEEERLPLNDSDVQKLVVLRNTLDHVIENLPVDHAQSSEVRRVEATAMKELLGAIIETCASKPVELDSRTDTLSLSPKVLEHFGFQAQQLTLEGKAFYQRRLTEKAEDAVAYYNTLDSRSLLDSTLLGMSPADKALAIPASALGLFSEEQASADIKQEVDDMLSDDPASVALTEGATAVVESIRRLQESFGIDAKTAHLLVRANADNKDGYLTFDANIEAKDVSLRAKREFLGSVAANLGSLKVMKGVAISPEILKRFQGDILIHLSHVSSEVRRLENGVLQQVEESQVDRMTLGNTAVITREGEKPFILIKKVIHIIPASDSSKAPEVRLVGYRVYSLHPIAKSMLSVMHGSERFEDAKENQFDSSGIYKSRNAPEKALLGKVKTIAENYLNFKGRPEVINKLLEEPSTNIRDQMIAILEKNKGHEATYYATLILEIVKTLEDKKEIVTEADYKAAIRTIINIESRVEKSSRLRHMLRPELDRFPNIRKDAGTASFSYVVGKAISECQLDLHIERNKAKQRWYSQGENLLDDDNSVLTDGVLISTGDTHEEMREGIRKAWLGNLVDLDWRYLKGLSLDELKSADNTKAAKFKEIVKLLPSGPSVAHHPTLHEAYREFLTSIQTVVKGVALTELTLEECITAAKGRITEICNAARTDRGELTLDADIVDRIGADALQLVEFAFQELSNAAKLKHNAKVARTAHGAMQKMEAIVEGEKNGATSKPAVRDKGKEKEKEEEEEEENEIEQEEGEGTPQKMTFQEKRVAILRHSSEAIEAINTLPVQHFELKNAEETKAHHLAPLKAETHKHFITLLERQVDAGLALHREQAKLENRYYTATSQNGFSDDLNNARSFLFPLKKSLPENSVLREKQEKLVKEWDLQIVKGAIGKRVLFTEDKQNDDGEHALSLALFPAVQAIQSIPEAGNLAIREAKNAAFKKLVTAERIASILKEEKVLQWLPHEVILFLHKTPSEGEEVGKPHYVSTQQHNLIKGAIDEVLKAYPIDTEQRTQLAQKMIGDVEETALRDNLDMQMAEWIDLPETERNEAIETYVNYFVGLTPERKTALIAEFKTEALDEANTWIFSTEEKGLGTVIIDASEEETETPVAPPFEYDSEEEAETAEEETETDSEGDERGPVYWGLDSDTEEDEVGNAAASENDEEEIFPGLIKGGDKGEDENPVRENTANSSEGGSSSSDGEPEPEVRKGDRPKSVDSTGLKLSEYTGGALLFVNKGLVVTDGVDANAVTEATTAPERNNTSVRPGLTVGEGA